ncbi:MAG: hypothetical protein RL754_769 [Bacteroidota bacterium]
MNKHIYTYLFLALLLLNGTDLLGQGKSFVSWYLEEDRAIEVVDVMTGEHFVIIGDNTDTLDPYVLDWNREGIILPPRGHLHNIEDRMLVSFGGDGKVLHIDTNTRTVKRVDNTYHHGYNFGSYSFVRNDTIFSWSGYGFWTNSNTLTFFSETRKEWNLYAQNEEVYRPNGEKFNEPPGFYDAKEDALFVWGSDNVFVFDFKKHEWRVIGQPVLDLHGMMKHRLSDTTFMASYEDRAYEIWPAGNGYYDITMANKANVPGRVATQKQWLSCAYEGENELLIPKYSDKTRTGVVLEFVPRFYRMNGSLNQLYEENGPLLKITLYSALVVLTIILVMAVMILRRRMLLKRSRVFNDEQWAVVNELSSGPIGTERLNVLLGLESASWETQRRKRSEVIKELNALGVSRFGMEIIIRVRSDKDKRQVEYQLNPNAETELARLM